MKAVQIAVLLAVILAAAGCGNMCGTDDSQFSGIIEYRDDYRIGKAAPDIVFSTVGNRQKALEDVNPISIIIFGDSTETVPPMLDLADRYRYESVSVAQVYRSGGGERIAGSNLISLCDRNRIAWNQYGWPESGTVFLVDADRRIVAVENIANVAGIVRYADKLARVQDEIEQDVYLN